MQTVVAGITVRFITQQAHGYSADRTIREYMKIFGTCLKMPFRISNDRKTLRIRPVGEREERFGYEQKECLAMLLAGGQGSRLKRFDSKVAKPAHLI